MIRARIGTLILLVATAACVSPTARSPREELGEFSARYLALQGSGQSAGGWPAVSFREARARRKKLAELREEFRRSALRGASSALSEAERVDLQVLEHELETEASLAAFPEELMPVTFLDGFQIEAPQRLAALSLRTDAERARALELIRGLPSYVESTRRLMEEGLDQGVLPSREAMKGVESQVRSLMEKDPAKNPLLFALRAQAGVPEQVARDAEKILRESVAPALEAFLGFLTGSYLPKCRPGISWAELPQGEQWYAARVRAHATLDLAPGEVHELGLRETARLRAEIEKRLKALGIQGGPKGFLAKMKADPKSFPATAGQAIDGYEKALAKARAFTAKHFHRLPRKPVEVRRVMTGSKDGINLYYRDNASDPSVPAGFFVRTQELSFHPRWQMETVTLHEALPGHHLQLALANELEDLSALRRSTHFTAFIEGWGQYAESLGREQGFFSGPKAVLGQLLFEADRAARMVADTGIHSKGWSLEQANRYLEENTGRFWAQRLVAWPGQGLAYMVGHLKIVALRDEAKAKLGRCFDLRRFHDAVLGGGTLPLNVLEQRIQKWVALEAGKPGCSGK